MHKIKMALEKVKGLKESDRTKTASEVLKNFHEMMELVEKYSPQRYHPAPLSEPYKIDCIN